MSPGVALASRQNGRATVKHDEAIRETKALRFDAPPYSSYVSIARTSTSNSLVGATRELAAQRRHLCQDTLQAQ